MLDNRLLEHLEDQGIVVAWAVALQKRKKKKKVIIFVKCQPPKSGGKSKN